MQALIDEVPQITREITMNIKPSSASNCKLYTKDLLAIILWILSGRHFQNSASKATYIRWKTIAMIFHAFRQTKISNCEDTSDLALSVEHNEKLGIP
ncbi:hypothetical protein SADUNF_Sadunf17G0015800 [Salix dunnii]|uniref:Uncharacterized protein n=1 Tax=Salix dunnii TaxID=1413687 RepID=A0A835J515_9ROSI|nr:hypothetical protein SADUNF_Sadunf17G0015800 [Salix dunnii]